MIQEVAIYVKKDIRYLLTQVYILKTNLYALFDMTTTALSVIWIMYY